LHGYLKYGNLVVRMRFPYLELANRQPPFIERRAVTPAPVPAVEPEPVRAQAEPHNQQELFLQ
jgi:hypothetical protein